MRNSLFRALILPASAFALAALAPLAAAAQIVAYDVVDGVNAPAPLSEQPGDPAEGRILFLDEKVTRCTECHALEGLSQADASKGPALDAVGARLSASAIRLWLINPRLRLENPAMPAYFSRERHAAEPGAPESAPPLQAPLLTGAQIEHLVAFLESQK